MSRCMKTFSLADSQKQWLPHPAVFKPLFSALTKYKGWYRLCSWPSRAYHPCRKTGKQIWKKRSPHGSLSVCHQGAGSLWFIFLPWGWYHLHVWGCWYVFQQSWFQLVIHPAWHFTWCIVWKGTWMDSFKCVKTREVKGGGPESVCCIVRGWHCVTLSRYQNCPMPCPAFPYREVFTSRPDDLARVMRMRIRTRWASMLCPNLAVYLNSWL